MERGKITLGVDYLVAYGTDWKDDESRWRRARVVDVGPFLAAETSWQAPRITLAGTGVDVRADYWMREGDPDRKRDRSVKYGVGVAYLTFAGEPTGHHDIVPTVDIRRTWDEHMAVAGDRIRATVALAAAVAETARLAARAGITVREGVSLPYAGREDYVAVRRPAMDNLLRLAAGLGAGEDDRT